MSRQEAIEGARDAIYQIFEVEGIAYFEAIAIMEYIKHELLENSRVGGELE